MTHQRIAVIMAGGSGERFWPLSRRTKPKQLLKLASDTKTLIEQTVDRVEPLVGRNNVWIAAAPHLVEPISQALSGQVVDAQILAEPHKRNTAGCLVWLCAQLLAQNPAARETISMAVIAADHRIHPEEGFRATMSAALTVAEQTGGLVTMGIRPDRPETGYGYIQAKAEGCLNIEGIKVWPVQDFREKPQLEQAQEYLDSGSYLWNSGSFFWTLDSFLTELQATSPDLYDAVFVIADRLRKGDLSAADAAFAELRNISIDYALMEKASKVYVAEAAFDWDDVGAWDALDRTLTPDEKGNVIQGGSVLVDTSNCIVINANERIVTTTLGVQDIAVIVTEDAVLVMPKSRAQDVRKIVEALREQGHELT